MVKTCALLIAAALFLCVAELLDVVGDEVAGISNASVIKCRVSDGVKPNTWSAGVTNSCNNLVLVQLVTPPNTIIGRASLTIDTVRLPSDSVSTSSLVSVSVADEYDIVTGGLDVKEQQV